MTFHTEFLQFFLFAKVEFPMGALESRHSPQFCDTNEERPESPRAIRRQDNN